VVYGGLEERCALEVYDRGDDTVFSRGLGGLPMAEKFRFNASSLNQSLL
jgi:hypothetical protein